MFLGGPKHRHESYSRDVESESINVQNFSIKSFELANGRADQSDAATIGQCSTTLENLSMNSVYVSLFTASMFEAQQTRTILSVNNGSSAVCVNLNQLHSIS